MTPDKIQEFEDYLQDKLNGWIGDDIQDIARKLELRESLLDDLCELP